MKNASRHLLTLGQGQAIAGDFDTLVARAPNFSEATLTLTGTIYRSDNDGKFILLTPDGQSVELDIGAIKDHTDGADGTTQLTVAADQIPPDQRAKLMPPQDASNALAAATANETAHETAYETAYETIYEMTWDAVGTAQQAGGMGNPAGQIGGGMVPFGLAVPPHAPYAALMIANMARMLPLGNPPPNGQVPGSLKPPGL